MLYKIFAIDRHKERETVIQRWIDNIDRETKRHTVDRYVIYTPRDSEMKLKRERGWDIESDEEGDRKILRHRDSIMINV